MKGESKSKEKANIPRPQVGKTLGSTRESGLWANEGEHKCQKAKIIKKRSAVGEGRGACEGRARENKRSRL